MRNHIDSVADIDLQTLKSAVQQLLDAGDAITIGRPAAQEDYARYDQAEKALRKVMRHV